MRMSLASAATLVIAALTGTPHVALAQTNAPFCLKTAAGQLSCTFSTMAECEQARGSQSAGQCITRSTRAERQAWATPRPGPLPTACRPAPKDARRGARKVGKILRSVTGLSLVVQFRSSPALAARTTRTSESKDH